MRLAAQAKFASSLIAKLKFGRTSIALLYLDC